MHDISTLKHMDQEALLHPASSASELQRHGPDLMLRAEGNYVYDENNRPLLDGIAGLWCVNVGYGERRLANAMAQAAIQLGYYHSFNNASNPWQIELAHRLLELAPANMGKVFFGSGGSDANDTLVKVAWQYHAVRGKTSKVKVMAREQAYHGTSISTASLTGLGSFHKGYPMPLDFVVRVPCPHYYTRAHVGETEHAFCERMLSEIDARILEEGPDTIAAFIAEPLFAAGGIIEPPEGYYPALRRLLSRYDILLIADEVVCAYGRLGAWFGSELLGMDADMISTAKALTSGYFPMSAAFISSDIYDVLLEGSEKFGAFFHGYTFSGHPVGAAVALENLAILTQDALISSSAERGKLLHERLREVVLPLPHVGEIRGRGLLAGIQLVADKAQKQVPEISAAWPKKCCAALRERGIIARPLPSVGTIALSPPLTITEEQIHFLVEQLQEVLSTLGTEIQ